MKRFARISKSVIAVLLALIMALPVSAFDGGGTVTVTDAAQFCGAYINLGGINYLCGVDLGSPVIDSAAEASFSPGTTVRFYLYFTINDAWYPVRETELQGTPSELFTLQFEKTSGGECVSDITWKTYSDDAFGAKYYAEFTITGGNTATALDVSVALTQPTASNIGASYQITGTAAAKERCVADFALPDYTGPCLVDFGQALASVSDTAAMVEGSTVCFPLNFIGGDGAAYPALSTELQGNPDDLFTVAESITSGNTLLTCNGWKTWENNHWYLEYQVSAATEETALAMTVQLTQPLLYRQSSAISFTGTAPAAITPLQYCKANINLGGTNYLCAVDFAEPVLSFENGGMAGVGATIRLNLMFEMGGAWYAVRQNELQGIPAELFIPEVLKTAGGARISSLTWKTYTDDSYGPKYYAELTILGAETIDPFALSVCLTQPGDGNHGATYAVNGTAAAWELCVANFVLSDYSGACLVDLGEAVTDGAADALSEGSVIRFALRFLGGDGNYYPAYASEMQGNPSDLFTVKSTITAGSELLSGAWVTDAAGRWCYQFTVSEPAAETPIRLSVQLAQPAVFSQGETHAFSGTAVESGPAYCTADISIGGVLYECKVDFRGYLPANATDFTPGTTIRLPLMFLGGDGAWYAVRANELSGSPADLFDTVVHITNGGAALTDLTWVASSDDAYGAKYYAEFTVTGEGGAQALSLTAQLTQTDSEKAGVVVAIDGMITEKEPCVADFVLNGYTGACLMAFGSPLTSTGDASAMTAGSTVCFPLMFIGGDGAAYPALATEMQGTPDALFTVRESIAAGGTLLICNGWKTWDNHHWYLEYQVSETSSETPLELTVQLTQPSLYRQSKPVSFAGTAPAAIDPDFDLCKATIDINGTEYLCVVDLRGYFTTTGAVDLPTGSYISIPLMFRGGDGQWYAVRENELKGTPEALFTPEYSIADGDAVLSAVRWSTYTDDEYGAKYCAQVQIIGDGTPAGFAFSLTLKQPEKSGEPVSVSGTVTGKERCVADFVLDSYSGPCLIELGTPLTSTGNAENMTGGSTICFPLMFVGGNGALHPAYDTELQGKPSDLFTVNQVMTAGGALLTCNGWKTWDNHHWYLEYQVAEVSGNAGIDMSVCLTQPSLYRESNSVRFTGTAPAASSTPCRAEILLDGTVYNCDVDVRGYLTGGGSDKLSAGDTICFPLMFLGSDGQWYPVLQSELQGVPKDLFAITEEFVSGGGLLDCNGWKTWENGHYYIEYVVSESRKNEAIEFSVTITRDGRRGEKDSFRGSIDGTVISLTQTDSNAFPGAQFTTSNGSWWAVDLGKPFATADAETGLLKQGSTIRAELWYIDADGAWSRATRDNMLQSPASWFRIKFNVTSGAGCLTNPVWRADGDGAWYAEWTILDPKEETQLSFTAALTDGRSTGARYHVSGMIEGGGTGVKMQAYYDSQIVLPWQDFVMLDAQNLEAEKAESNQKLGATFTISDVNYAPDFWAVDLGGPYAKYASSGTLYADSVIVFDLMFQVNGQWYPVRNGEINESPEEILDIVCEATKGSEILGTPALKTRSDIYGDIWFVEVPVLTVAQETLFDFTIYLTQTGGNQSSKYRVTGTAAPGTSFPQIPLKESASLLLERLAESERFNTMSFTIADVRYDDNWPIDFESPNTSSAVITDGSIIRSDLCFMVNGNWYPVRQQECNYDIAELVTYEYQVLEGAELLTVPKFSTRYDLYGDIWQFEVGISAETEGRFSFTLQLVSTDGQKKGSLYKVTGNVRNGELVSYTEQELPAEETPEKSPYLWRLIGGAGAVVLLGCVVLAVCIKRRKKRKDAGDNT